MNTMFVRTAVAVAVLGAAGVGVLGIASAADDPVAAANTKSAPDNDSGDGWRGPWGGGHWGSFGGFGGLGGVDDMLHGEVVMATDGGTETMLVQKGTVTSVSPTSVAVTSTDGFATTYTVDADTEVNGGHDELAEVAQNDEIVVVAPKSDAPTATAILDC